ncbi:hypothetical protein [Saccharothrix obliqua]|uniref:hypothetical protein n=1 Tax=Saccharothrix obliqua TaxID=2861747 RepID=UPI001C5CFBE1|nr:hypothetical protein [Saccharothrix obliqua]MBW4720740.1 hypothetical protein [Saccharothrix obliqua]
MLVLVGVACKHKVRAHRLGLAPVEAAGTPLRWVLLCALALGVLGTHHLSGGHAAHPAKVVATAQDPSAATPPTPDHGAGDDLLGHLCLAVLAAATGAGLALALRRTPRGQTTRTRVAAIDDGYPRPPPTPTSTRLASLRVLRR